MRHGPERSLGLKRHPRQQSRASNAGGGATHMPKNSPVGSADWIDPGYSRDPISRSLARADAHGHAFVPHGRGRPRSSTAKEQVSVRLDPDVLMVLRAGGPGWQSRINALLRQALRIGKPAA